MIDKTDNADNTKTTKVRVTNLAEADSEACYVANVCGYGYEYEYKMPQRNIEVTCSGNSFSCSFIVEPKDQIYQIGDIIEITYKKC